ncbi:aldo/keto reductase [Alteromonas sediminis]|uniref:Aldo/keto reductase n=1 Tax=Alteromonas sediminis TaxID=2259342 RepID=A0A3N5XWY1_9ALTE|nr:aldo/keto reductase [Alteromonas sediminis]RPJ65232.1 aldo/keto reductase [Alteromonas sediminis]
MQRARSEIIYGCMGFGGDWSTAPISKADQLKATTLIETAIEQGVTTFDHADIYTLGKAEEVFGNVLRTQPALRDKIQIQTKCGIRFQSETAPGRYDFSKAWIEASVDGSLKRLQIEQIDTLLLHRPDALVEVDELAETLSGLIDSGKIKHVGVSNMNRFQIALLQSSLPFPITANQLEISLLHADLIKEGLFFNTGESQNGADTLAFCQANRVSIQAWGSLAQGKLTGGTATSEAEMKTAELVQQLAEEYRCSKEAIVIAWLLRHPAQIAPVLGTTNPARLTACMQAADIWLTREHWYQLLITALGKPLP